MFYKIEKPKKRSALRQQIGKEFFIFKRYCHWYFNKASFAKKDKRFSCPFSVIKHQSFLLRPLNNVAMQLQYNKITNLAIAIKKIDAVIIKPGQVFSIWKLTGRPTKGKGYLDGLALHNGEITKSTGGGLCQLGNLIYWMALHSPLAIKERWRHSYDVFPDINRTIPFGCGATLAYNYIDLQLLNNTSGTFQLNFWLDKEYLYGEIKSNTDMDFSYEIFETGHCFQHQWWGGYTRHNKIWRRIINKTTGSVREELVTENNAIMMYEPLLMHSRD
jgi:vancomycin resistance protein VanW